MKTNLFLVASAALAILLASCVMETRLSGGKELTVRIAIRQEGVVSRAAGAPVADNAEVQFRDGLLLFTDNSYKITKRIEVEDNGGAYDSDRVGRGALESETTITGVPSVSTKVYFVGNPSSDVKNAAMVGTAMGSLETNVLYEMSSTGGVENVTLFGGSQLNPSDTTGESVNYTARFDIAPIVTRIEIGSITGTHTSGEAGKLTCKVTGIFINKYYSQMPVGGTVMASLVDNGTTVANYITDGTGSYISNRAGLVHDYSASGLTLNPGQVWAYNLLAPRSGGEMPSIVVRLEDVVVNNVAMNAPQYITLSTFKKGSALLTELKQGEIWEIGSITFDENDIAPAPYVKSKSVKVEIELMKWKKYPVTVEY